MIKDKTDSASREGIIRVTSFAKAKLVIPVTSFVNDNALAFGAKFILPFILRQQILIKAFMLHFAIESMLKSLLPSPFRYSGLCFRLNYRAPSSVTNMGVSIHNSFSCVVKLFADDTCLLIHSKNPSSLEININEALTNIQEWTSTNKLTVNSKKSSVLIISSKKTNPIPKHHIKFDDTSQVKFIYAIKQKQNIRIYNLHNKFTFKWQRGLRIDLSVF